MDYSIVSAEKSHITQISDLETNTFSYPMSDDMLYRFIENPNNMIFAALAGEKLIGYAGISTVIDEGYITNVAVEQQFRRHGIARALVSKVLQFAEMRELRFVSLEVREKNNSAINLYDSCGFIVAGVMHNYYSMPVDNALIMTKFITSDGD